MAKYLGEYSNDYNSIIQNNRDENLLIEKANITLDLHHSHGVDKDVVLKDVECVELDGEKGFVTYLDKGDIYMFYPESEVSKVEPLGKKTKIIPSDIPSISFQDYNEAIINSRNEKKENISTTFISNLYSQKIENAVKVNTDKYNGYMYTISNPEGRKVRKFAPLKTVKNIVESQPYINLTNKEILEIRKKEEEKEALSKYFEIKKYFSKNNISVNDFPNLDDFTSSPNMGLINNASNIKILHERYVDNFGRKPDLTSDISSQKLYTNIEKQFIENEFSKNISDFQDLYGFTVEFNLPTSDDILEISIKSKNGEELSQCSLNLEFITDGDDCLAVAPIMMEYDIEDYDENELPLISENGETIFNYKESKFSAIYKVLDRICFEHSYYDEFGFVEYDVENEP